MWLCRSRAPVLWPKDGRRQPAGREVMDIYLPICVPMCLCVCVHVTREAGHTHNNTKRTAPQINNHINEPPPRICRGRALALWPQGSCLQPAGRNTMDIYLSTCRVNLRDATDVYLYMYLCMYVCMRICMWLAEFQPSGLRAAAFNLQVRMEDIYLSIYVRIYFMFVCMYICEYAAAKLQPSGLRAAAFNLQVGMRWMCSYICMCVHMCVCVCRFGAAALQPSGVRFATFTLRQTQNRAEGGFGLTPGKLLTLKWYLLLPQRGREPSAEILFRVNSVKPSRYIRRQVLKRRACIYICTYV